MINTVFVYGTLMTGFIYHEKYLSDYIIEKHTGYLKGDLYHLNYGYPAAVDGEGLIKGEIFIVKEIADILPSLDMLEDYHNCEADLYIRQIRDIRDTSGNVIPCYVYMWSPKRKRELDLAGTKIEHGDWRKFMVKKG